MTDNQNKRQYKPQLLPRRGEVTAWGLLALMLASWGLMKLLGVQTGLLTPLLALALLLAAGSISLGNWIDRHTLLHLDDQGIEFQNGLRHVHLDWQQIERVRVHPTAWGKRVQVFGAKTYFAFQTPGEVKYQGKVTGKTGFLRGDEILREIVLNSELEIVDQVGDSYEYERR